MKQSRRYIALALVALTSALFLGACGGNKQEATTASSSTKTTSMVKSTKPKQAPSMSSSAKQASSAMMSSSESMASAENSQPAPAQDAPAVQAQPAPAAPQASQSQAGSQGQPAASSTSAPTHKASNEREKGVLALTKGDYSKAAGTWTDGKGNTVTVDASGSVTIQKAGEEPQSYAVYGYKYTLDDGQYQAQLSGEAGNARIQITTGDDGAVTAVQVLP